MDKDKTTYETLDKQIQRLKAYMEGTLPEEEQDWEKVRQHIGGRRRWPIVRYAAAASAVLLLGAGIWWTIDQRSVPESPTIAIIDRTPAPAQGVRLELASGKQFTLDDTSCVDISEAGAVIRTERAGTLSVNARTTDSLRSGTAYNRLTVPQREDYHLILADGSEVWLNSESVVEFPSDFTGDERRVRLLSGEAFFEVAPDKSKPFVVSTPELEVNVTGTTFNVMAYGEEPQTEVTLVTGKVGVRTAETEATLSPSQQFALDRQTGKHEVREVDVSPYVAWKEGVLSFASLPLEELGRRIQRWYGVKFEFVRGETKRLKFSGELRREYDIGYVCRLLETISGISFTMEGDRVVIGKK